ncbi:predicted protein [Lichtheimia corymbifera JMRC:FSU:9682]|uniref:Uncharacterized protein n=1 Tax=Lichtheimia corymbifera JMRC:FSU:9682 TaxID=1263082 RepID=A0A068RLP3_9FUNG|nr:predicted protein [Lichtheimia corymbifera JMRC:FSU:9682]
MDAIKCNDGEPWNIALVTCRVVSRNEGSYHLITNEDDDGFDGIEYRCSTAVDDISEYPINACSNVSRIMDEGVYDGSNQECNDTIIPIASM